MKSGILLIVLLAGAVLGSGVGVVYTQHANRQLFIQLQKLQAERDDIEIEWESLQLEQSTLVTDAVVEEMARKRLKMLIPDPGEVLYITPHEHVSR
ncbi:MAG TPA: cell division protein FtsL [Xanthomonadaceae bacterium]|nr:cell division protein FtsL [Xanthomonadaceae bacterium]